MNETQAIRGMLRQMMIFSSLAAIVIMMNAVANTIIVGMFLGEAELAAAGLPGVIMIFCIAMSSMLFTGGQIHVTRRIGMGDREGANAYFSVAVASVTAVSSLIGVAIYVFDAQTAWLIGGSRAPELIPLIADYLHGLSFGLPFNMLMLCLSPYLQLDGDNKRIVATMLVVLATDVAGVLFSVLVLHGGLFGVAFAMSMSSVFGLLVTVGHFFGKRSAFRMTLPNVSDGKKLLRDIVAAGFPGALQRVYSSVANLCMNYIVLTIVGVPGGTTQTVRGIVSGLFMTIGTALGLATMSVAGLMYGEENRKDLKLTATTAIKMGFKVTIVLAIILFVGADFIAAMFQRGASDTLEMTVRSLRFFAFAIPFCATCDILFGYLRAISMPRIATVIPLCEYLIFPVCLSWWLGNTSLGDNGIWVAYPLGALLSVLVVLVIVSVKTGKPAVSLSDVAIVPEGFGVDEKNFFAAGIEDMNGVVEASKKAGDFCLSRTGDKSRANKCALIVEETCKNIVQHGFQTVKKPKIPHIDLRVFWKEGTVHICIRDNCRPFNLKKMTPERIDAGTYEHLGIPIITGFASNIDYNYILRMNNVRIRV